jgi:transcriptional regulator with XRE-family HTH domain
MVVASATFAQVLRAKRKELGHTIREAGPACATTHATISRWETGRVIPQTVEQQLSVARYLEITNEELAQLLAETVRRNILGEIARHFG